MNDSPSGIVVALSGGLDSALAAALLKARGWKVFGIHFRLPAPGPIKEDRIRKVTQIARHLDIPIDFIDLQKEFEQIIIDPFVQSYRSGLTPNPCVRCNARIKFEYMSRFAEQKGIPFLGTGHYARLLRQTEDGTIHLLRGMDPKKDQSYFLHRLNAAILKRTVFPLGHTTKAAVKKMAAETNLPCEPGMESQEICFIPDMDYRHFVQQRKEHVMEKRGLIKDSQGQVLGEHNGIYHYTIGQRHGLRIASSRPYYVRKIDPKTHEVIVGRREEIYTTTVKATRFHWMGRPLFGEIHGLSAQVRYRHTPAPGVLEVLSSQEVRFTFHAPQWAVTPGQALVCCQGDRVIGGGWITASSATAEPMV
ncbi:MAG: tRNA 2-thiouridine(34) synthase MnmA [Thermodesulfobacteriota bacterium]